MLTGNIQDTVTDTPMRNYAVLSEGGNGNLLANSPVAAGIIDATIYKDDFYFEVTMTAGNDSSGTSGIHVIVKNEAGTTVTIWRSDTGDKYTTGDVVAVAIKDNEFQWFKNGSPVSLVGSGSTQPGSDSATGTSFTASFNNCNDDVGRGVYNFGQQPFAASNVTYDQDAGTVEIDGETYGTLYQTWDEWATSTRSSLNGALTTKNITNILVDEIYDLREKLSDVEADRNSLRSSVQDLLSRVAALES